MPTWMNRSKESEAARQAEARQRRQAAGNCIKCGLARDPKSVQLCTRHLAQQRDYMNARNANKRREGRAVAKDGDSK